MVDHNDLIYLPANVPRWMLNKIRAVQGQLQERYPAMAVTRTDAVRLILIKGLEALGIESENTETKEKEAKAK